MASRASKDANHTLAPVKIPLDQIELGDRLRDPRAEDVKTIQASMAEVGLMTPISVRLIEDGRYRIVYGAHRFLAAQNLLDAGIKGWEEIDAFVIECDDNEARLRETDENLIRIDLSPYDQAEFFYHRLMIWEKKYGPAKRGGDHKSNKSGSDQKSNSQRANLVEIAERPGFYDDAERQIGLDQTTIRRAVKRREGISDEVWKRLRGTDISRQGVLLDRFLKTSDPVEIIELAEREYGGSIQAALNRKVPKAKTAPSVERVLKIIDEALELWSEEDRKRFLREMRGRK